MRRRRAPKRRRWREGTCGAWVGCSWVGSIIKPSHRTVKPGHEGLNREQILQLLDDERPRFAGYARVVEHLHDVTRFRGVDGSHRVVVIAAGFDPKRADATIDRELAHHRALGGAEFEWTVYGHHAPANMVERLAR